LSYDPFDAVDGGDFVELTGVAHVGSNVLVLFGITSTDTNRLIAYNATTLRLLATGGHAHRFRRREYDGHRTIGWLGQRRAARQGRIPGGTGTGSIDKAITCYDVAGDVVASFPISDSSSVRDVSALVHDPVADRLYIVVPDGNWMTLWVMPRPAPTDTVLTATHQDLNKPCGYVTQINGTDAAGNLHRARAQGSADEFRACVVTPAIEFVPLPYTWSVQDSSGLARGFVAPDGAHFVMHQVNGRITIERGAYQ
jgi:hypothetical protein